MTDHWTNAGQLPSLTKMGRALFKHSGHQIVVFDVEGQLFAVNNRCPHEGYPLMEGVIQKDCKLSCSWHSWSFDLTNGDAVQGRDPLRTYPIERRGDNIWIDLTPIPQATLAAKAWDELGEAMSEHDYTRIARSLARLDRAGVEADEIAIWAIKWSHDKFERGFMHSHAGLADWLSLREMKGIKLPIGAAAQKTVPLLEALAHLSYEALFSPHTPFGDGVNMWSADAFAQAIEAQDQTLAHETLRGALAEGLRFKDLKPIFTKLVYAHYLGFGHAAIYLMKVEELTHRLDQAVEMPLMLMLVRYLCIASREDLIPEFSSYRDAMAANSTGFEASLQHDALIGLRLSKAHQMVLDASGSWRDKFDILWVSAAQTLLHFDSSHQDIIDQPISRNVGWLQFTHALTFAEATVALLDGDSPHWKAAALQLVNFIGRQVPHLLGKPNPPFSGDAAAFLDSAKSALFNMDAGDYIYAVHRLKMTVAVERSLPLMEDNAQNILLGALQLYLGSHIRQRSPIRDALQAIKTVSVEG